MRLQVLLPHEVLVDLQGVTKVVAESHHGVFALLPRHVDFAAPLVPGLLLYEVDGREEVMGVDAGTLVKEGDRVRVSVHDAVRAPELERVRELVRERFHALEDREQRARSAMARLESSFYRSFLEQGGLGDGR